VQVHDARGIVAAPLRELVDVRPVAMSFPAPTRIVSTTRTISGTEPVILRMSRS
jgi:hypothetical protein